MKKFFAARVNFAINSVSPPILVQILYLILIFLIFILLLSLTNALENASEKSWYLNLALAFIKLFWLWISFLLVGPLQNLGKKLDFFPLILFHESSFIYLSFMKASYITWEFPIFFRFRLNIPKVLFSWISLVMFSPETLYTPHNSF